MKATLDTCFTITLDGAIAAATARDRVEPTPAGRAYIAVKKAEELTNDCAADVQEGADPETIWQSMDMQDKALTSRPEAVRTVQTLDVTQYRQWAESRLHADGELLPGVEHIGERESFSIRFGKDGK